MPAELPAPMTGTIKEIRTAPGQQVTAGQEVFIVESMKMEIPVEADQGGVVAEVLVREGDRVEQGQPLLRLA
ncbi:acetyl-CoA carboxylase biotin carboxyl carrier protein subunit [Tepidiforma sp.]|uniref:acetyl-CoA carboxylase biotin carboxyl carrier protein subunit n=1 Tax=Tepidiforma sp. TaxID=2682230 RepID=UPI002ADDD50C|nr:acetyl-CoA carboxylase biotin carboxyl carrier protein subunit [Tepidiforma sp.]